MINQLDRYRRYAPLAPLAIAGSMGIVLDRCFHIPTVDSLLFSVVAGIAQYWVSRRHSSRPPWFAWLAFAGLGAAHHHSAIRDIPRNDVSRFITDEPRLARIRGVIEQEPAISIPPKHQPLLSRPRSAHVSMLVEVDSLEDGKNWLPVCGLIRINLNADSVDLHVADKIEATGWLAGIPDALNPGESPPIDWAMDQGIRGSLHIRGSAESIVRIGSPDGKLLQRLLQTIRNFARNQIESAIRREGPLAQALLLGDTQAIGRDDWEQYARTGVIHVLAISGQHLVILGAVVWQLCRWIGISRKRGALIVAGLLLGYALLTGGRPSAMRAAVMACAVCGGILVRKPVIPANMFAAAWLAVLVLNPADLFNAGFQLSFWCVAVLIWGASIWLKPRELTPLEELIEESRHWTTRTVRSLSFGIAQTFAIGAILGIATAPLTMYWQHSFSFAGFLIGPLAIFLTTIALIAGFLTVLAAPIPYFGIACGWIADQSLRGCDVVVRESATWTWACGYVADIPMWWLIGFHAVGVWLLWSTNFPEEGKTLAKPLKIMLVWMVAGGVLAGWRSPPDETRVTFLAVDHGNCTVIETPDGRVILADAGSMMGPEITRRVIAPFLWSRGITKIDEVFLSHADLDHFNGLIALSTRFSIGCVTITPTFAEKQTPGTQLTMAELKRRGIPVRIVTQGDLLQTGEGTMQVLHPPPDGPPGIENIRSMTLLAEYSGKRILITGDLQGEGVARLVSQPPVAVDVLMTPHHGSGAESVEALARWCQPKLVVSSQGRTDPGKAEGVYRRLGIPYWATWPNGAITLHCHPTGLFAETFSTKRTMVLASSPTP